MTTQPPPGRYLRYPPAAGARVRLFCFPYAGGGASLFYPWTRGLSPAVAVCPVHLPGREDRLKEAPFTRMTDLVEELARQLRPWTEAPFALFGHSLGGLVCFELARRLGRAPVRLFVSAARAPQVPERPAPVHHLGDADFVAALRLRYQGLPAAVLEDAELLSLFLPALRADFTLFDTYAYEAGGPLDCPVSAFGGARDPEVRESDLLAWREQTRGPFELRRFAGGHFFLKEEQDRALRAIADDLAE